MFNKSKSQITNNEQVQQPEPIVAPPTETKPKITNPNLAISQGMGVIDAISPQAIEEDFDYIKINDVYFRTIFVGGYPRFVAPGWLEPVVNFDTSLDISFYVYPVD